MIDIKYKWRAGVAECGRGRAGEDERGRGVMGDVGGDVEMEVAPGREEEEETGDAAEEGRVRRRQERSFALGVRFMWHRAQE